MFFFLSCITGKTSIWKYTHLFSFIFWCFADYQGYFDHKFTMSYSLYLPSASDYLDFYLLFLSKWYLGSIMQISIWIYKKIGISRWVNCNLTRQREIHFHQFSKIIILQESDRKHNNRNRLKSLGKSSWKRNRTRNIQKWVGWTQARQAAKVGDDISISANASCWEAHYPQANTTALLLGLKVICLPSTALFFVDVQPWFGTNPRISSWHNIFCNIYKSTICL